MNSIKYLTAVFASFVLQSANAFSVDLPDDVKQEIEQESMQAAERYAASTGKTTPQPVDYKYGMKLDVAKVVYMTPTISHCGNVSKLMTYEDSQGELYTIRYLVQGQCRNNK